MKTKKRLSFLLALSICLGIVFSFMNMSGLDFVSANNDINSEVWFVLDNKKVLINGKRLNLEEAPYSFAEKDSAFVPLKAICTYLGAKPEISGDNITVTEKGGRRVKLSVNQKVWNDGKTDRELGSAPTKIGSEIFLLISDVETVFSLKSFFNREIGLIVFSHSQMTYSTDYNSLKIQVSNLGKLLFDRPSGKTVFDTMQKNIGSNVHPRILADQNKFDELRAIYNDEKSKSPVKSVILKYMDNARKNISAYFIEENGKLAFVSEQMRNVFRQPYFVYDENGKRLDGVKEYQYIDEKGNIIKVECGGSGLGDGYDIGGRSSLAGRSINLKYLAFAWQMTGDDKYAQAFYLIAKELGKWKHWGEGHFLNCADGASEFAIGLDWIYHAFDDKPYERKEMYSILARLGMEKGYNSIMAETVPKNQSQQYINKLCLSRKMGSGWRILGRTNNWQTVCGSGMIISSLVLCEFPEYREHSLFVIEKLLDSLERCLMQYAPDGAYIESPGYWVYGTKTLYLMLGALQSSCKTTFGYKDIVGLKDSCYFAFYITDSDFVAWNYHDGGRGPIDRSVYYLASYLHGDPNISAMRDYMVMERGTVPDILDLLYYDENLSLGNTLDKQLDMEFKGIDSVTMRSSWESGANFAGLHAGPNDVPHGDIDSGSFYLEMGGTLWAGDPGSEDYNIPGYFGNQRYYYYRKSAEAHNTVIIRNDNSIKDGQARTKFTTSHAQIEKFYSDENGSYAVANMKSSYGNNCISGKRGLLMTNSRRTVIVQDEIKFNRPADLTWICALRNVNKISDDGRTVFARDYSSGELVELRMTLVSDNKDLKFTRMRKGNNRLLPYTKTGETERNPNVSNTEDRIVINANGVREFDVAVVFDIVKHREEVVGYKKVPIGEWTTCTDEWVENENSHIVFPEDINKNKYGYSDFAKAMNRIKNSRTVEEKVKWACSSLIYTTDYNKKDRRVADIVSEYIECLMGVIEEFSGANLQQKREVFVATLNSVKSHDRADGRVRRIVAEYYAILDEFNRRVEEINKNAEELFFGMLPHTKKR